MKQDLNVVFDTYISFEQVYFEVSVKASISLEEPDTNSPASAEIESVKDESGKEYVEQLSERAIKDLQEIALVAFEQKYEDEMAKAEDFNKYD